MAKDPDGMRAMGRRARLLFEDNFTCDASAAKYAEVLRLASPVREDAEAETAAT